MPRVVNAIWYSPFTASLDNIGIIEIEDHGETKFYIGTGEGFDEEKDIQLILEFGCRFYPEVFKNEKIQSV